MLIFSLRYPCMLLPRPKLHNANTDETDVRIKNVQLNGSNVGDNFVIS